MFDEKVYRELLKLAAEPGEDVPITACITGLGGELRIFKNEVYKRGSHIRHAEVLAITEALEGLGASDFKNRNVTLYSTLEPCTMCLTLASLARVSRVVYFLSDPKFGGVERIFTGKSALFMPEILYIEKQEVAILMKQFFTKLR